MDVAKASMELAAQRMCDAHGNWRNTDPDFQEGQQVWLDGKNLRLQVPSTKLAARHHGPFTIEEVMGPVTYRLSIPPAWKRIHPVFHVSLLTPYHETEEHGPNFARPPPDVEGEELTYEIEKIIDSALTRNKRGIQYRVRWKGYPPSEDQWIKSSELGNAREVIEDFHHRYPNKPGPRINALVVPGVDNPTEGVLSWDARLRACDTCHDPAGTDCIVGS